VRETGGDAAEGSEPLGGDDAFVRLGERTAGRAESLGEITGEQRDDDDAERLRNRRPYRA
jgi:hypothetical protein